MTVAELLARNKAWSARMRQADTGFFKRLASQQKPRYLWIGCSDSRVAANQILDLAPGEVFTHRNIANVVAPGDLNCLSVLQFAIDVLRVRHVMVVGHYGCGGIQAAVEGSRLGLVDIWLQHVHDVRTKHARGLAALSPSQQVNRLCELNVAEQFRSICDSRIVGDAWARSQALSIHGWVYGLEDGRLRELGLTASNRDQVDAAYRQAIHFPKVVAAGVSSPACNHDARHILESSP